MEEQTFTPEVILTPDDRAAIAQTTATRGWKVIIDKVMKPIVDRGFITHINVSESDEKAILASYMLAKAKAQFFTSIVNVINLEAQHYMDEVSGPQAPVDHTEGLIDLGASPSTYSDLQFDEQLLEEGVFDE